MYSCTIHCVSEGGATQLHVDRQLCDQPLALIGLSGLSLRLRSYRLNVVKVIGNGLTIHWHDF